MRERILALGVGYCLDLILGDPEWMPHPVRAIGRLITTLEHLLRRVECKNEKQEWMAGTLLCLLVLILTTGIPCLLLMLFYRWKTVAGIAVEGILCYYLLATKALQVESNRVYLALTQNRLEAARFAVARIVGRDTQRLNEQEITRAAVETVAENTSDGIIAPMFYMALGGAVGGFFYKAVNTMDSMIGYKNETYLYFGRTAAHLDDVLNYIPARLAAFLMIGAAYLQGFFDKSKEINGKRAFLIWKRDRKKSPSPNSAQTEAVCAGALGVQLLGDAYYFGVRHHKETLGDDLRPITPQDIRKTHILMYLTSLLGMSTTIFVSAWIMNFLK